MKNIFRIAGTIAGSLTQFIAQPHLIGGDFENLRATLIDTALEVGAALGLAAALLMLAAAGAGWLMPQASLTPDALALRLESLFATPGRNSPWSNSEIQSARVVR